MGICLWQPCRLRGRSGEDWRLSSDYLHNGRRTHCLFRLVHATKLHPKTLREYVRRATENDRLCRDPNRPPPSHAPHRCFLSTSRILRVLRGYRHANRCAQVLIFRFAWALMYDENNLPKHGGKLSVDHAPFRPYLPRPWKIRLICRGWWLVPLREPSEKDNEDSLPCQ